MRKRLSITLFTTFLFLMIGTFAVVSDVHAQPGKRDKQTKPNDKAKKLLNEGNKLLERNDFRGAIGKYAEAVVISPNYGDAHFWKGYSHYRLNEYNEAREGLDAAFNLGYSPIKVYTVRWVVNFQLQNYDAALNDVQKGLEKEPNNVDFNNALGEILVKKGDYRAAIVPLLKTLQRNPKSGNTHYFLALSYAKTGDSKSQILSATEAVKNGTTFMGESYVLLGDGLAVEGKPKEATDAYKRAINVKPDLPEDFYINLSQLYRSYNNLPEAIDIAQKGLKIYQKSKSLLINLTWYYSLADRKPEAVGAGQQAVKYAGEDAAAHTNLCRAYNDRGNYPAAVLSCNTALKLKPGDGETFLYLYSANTELGKKALAADYLKKAIVGLGKYTQDYPNDPDGFYLLGNALYNDNQFKKAVEAYKESIRLSPNFMKANYNLGNAYIADGKPDDAQVQYNKLLTLDKTYADKLKVSMGLK